VTSRADRAWCNDKTKKEMGKILKEIRSGKFAKQWIAENAGGRKEYNRLMQADLDHQLENGRRAAARAHAVAGTGPRLKKLTPSEGSPMPNVNES
jgi:ketol-acid reductoisomerase